MKGAKFRAAQLAFAFALKQAEDGTTISEVCRKAGTSDATFYAWRKEARGTDVAGDASAAPLADENAKLKRLVADVTFEKALLHVVVRRPEGATQHSAANALRPDRRRQLVDDV